MSSSTLRTRLLLTSPGPWTKRDSYDVDDSTGEVIASCLNHGDARFIAHAHTDLRLALDVIEAAAEVMWQVDSDKLAAALDAFEAAP